MGEDNIGGNYVLGRPSGEGHGTDRRGILFDWDGTITGTPMASVVKDEPFTTSSLCTAHANWGNMSVCPHRFSESGGSGDSYNKFDVVVTRDDIPQFPKVAMVNGEAWHLFLSVDHSYIYSFRNRSLPKAFVFISKGLDSGHSQLVGFCTPLGVPEEEIKFLGDHPRPVQVDSYVELLQDETGTAYFWDEEVGVLVHFDFLGLQLGTTFVTELQSSMKVAVILHWYFTFPHLTWPMSNCSVTRAGGAGVVVVVVVVVGGAPPPGHFGDIPAGQAPASRGQTCVNPGAQA